jgi:hypothetical protein
VQSVLAAANAAAVTDALQGQRLAAHVQCANKKVALISHEAAGCRDCRCTHSWCTGFNV